MVLSPQEIQKKQQLLSETDTHMAAAFKVLSDVNRYRIFRILADQPQISISNIAQILNISLPLASQHIKILTQANILKKERKGKKIFPKLAYENPLVPAVVQTIQEVLKKKL
ncbi:MAG: winged helix-turn-helix transcriptional regulator [Candidatus Magasanikbacteria bacterium]|nr:winged helix-turn-helix transcriptional regulator [Candidatus Magasanikbacteria bacterium]